MDDNKMSTQTDNETTDTTNATSPETDNVAAPVPEAATSGEVAQKKMSGTAIALIAGALLLVVGAIVWAATSSSGDSQDIDLSLPGSEATAVDFSSLPEVVATVNGSDIPRSEYESAYQQAASLAAQQGVDPANPSVQAQIETQAIERLINTEVLAQAAADTEVTAAAVAEEFANLETNFGGAEALAAELEAAGITREELEADIETQLKIDAFIQASPEWSEEFTVTQDEKQAFYDEVAAQSPEIPAFEEVEAQIEQQLLTEKQQAATQALIDRLLLEAEVMTYLDEGAE